MGVLEIPSKIHEQMIAQAEREAPLECCGMLGGRGSRVSACYPVANALASPAAYEGDAKETLRAFREMRERGLELIAIYHSHPSSPAVPSRVDLERNYYGEVPRLIISLVARPPEMRAYVLSELEYREVPWKIGGVEGSGAAG